MCLACGNIGDVTSVSLVANWVLALSPVFGMGLVKLYRLVSIRHLMCQPRYYLKLGVLFAGYNTVFYLSYLGVVALIVDFVSVWRVAVAITGPILFTVLWIRYLRHCFRYRPNIKRAAIWCMTLISVVPFMLAIVIFINTMLRELPYTTIPYYQVQWYSFYRDMGILFSGGLILLQVSIVHLFVEFKHWTLTKAIKNIHGSL